MFNRRTTTIALVTLLALVLAGVSSASFVKWRDGHDEAKRLRPLKATIATFPVPASATVSLPDASAKSPLQVSKGWRAAGSIDAACAAWREPFKAWIGTQDQRELSGEMIPNQSCTFTGKKNTYTATLLVAVYGNEPPQATLSVTAQ